MCTTLEAEIFGKNSFPAAISKQIVDPAGLFVPGDTVMSKAGISPNTYDPLKIGDAKRLNEEQQKQQQRNAVANAWASYGYNTDGTNRIVDQRKQTIGGNRVIGDSLGSAVTPQAGGLQIVK